MRPLEVGVVLVFAIGHVVCCDGDEVVLYVFNDVGASPDKLSGFDTILSAAASGIPKVEPEDHRFVLFLCGNETFVDRGFPVDLLEGEVACFGLGEAADGAVGFIRQLCRRGVLRCLGDQECHGREHSLKIQQSPVCFAIFSQRVS